MKYFFENFINILKIKNPIYIYYSFLFIFIIDSIVNYFTNIPVFVIFSILCLPVLWINIYLLNEKNNFIWKFIIIFILISILNNFIYEFNKKNISDVIFILLFPAIYYFYNKKSGSFNEKMIHVWLVICFTLFSFTFININANEWHKSGSKNTNNINLYNNLIKLYNKQVIVIEKVKKLNKLEHIRTYKNGLFRVPHVASYFLGLLMIFYSYLFVNRKNKLYLIIALLLFLLLIYVGVRTFIVALCLSLFIFLVKNRMKRSLIISIIIISIVILFRKNILILTKNSFIFQYSTFVVTSIDNFSNLSRFKLINSWIHEIRLFNWYDFLIGKNLFSSFNANGRNLNFDEWFHNDFLSIFYSYGVIAFIFYIKFLYNIFIENKELIKRNIFLFIYFFSLIFSAFFNGLYYYYPVFLLVPFILMVNVEKDKIAQKFNSLEL